MFSHGATGSAVYQRTAHAFRAGDMETLAELFDEDVVWHSLAQARSQARSAGGMRVSVLGGRFAWP